MPKQMKVLITGGSGLIGNRITQLLLKKGVEVIHLTRFRNSKSGVKTFEWNWENGTIDCKCFKDITHIIHLAGANISDKAWTSKQKRILVKSRVHTARLLFDNIHLMNKLEAFISASGIGYYGARTVNEIFTEEAEAYNDFIAKCCIQWEKSTDLFSHQTRIVKLRTGIVLDKNQGVVPKINSSIKMGLGAPLGKGSQYMPWIHIDDIARLYIYALTSPMEGVFNAVSSQHTTNSELTTELALQLNKKIWLKRITPFFIKSVYGEMADLFLNGSRISNEKLLQANFIFLYPTLKEALTDIIQKKT